MIRNITRARALLFVLACLVRTCPALTLDEAVEQAKSRNPDLGRLDAARQAASWKRVEALGGYLPKLDLRAERVLDTKYLALGVHFAGMTVTMPEAFPSITGDLDVNWTFFDGLKGYYTWAAADEELGANELDLQALAFRLERQVKILFYQVLADRQLEDVAARNLETLQSHLDLASATEESGMGTRFDTLRIEAQLEEAKAEQAAAKDATAAALEALGAAMGISGAAETPEGGLPVPPEKAEELAAAKGGDQRPEIRALERRVAALDDMSLAAGAAWLPKVSLTFNKDYYKYLDFDPAIVPNADFADDYTVGVKASWDIFDGGVTLARQRQASWAAESARQALSAARLKAGDEPAFWSRRLITSSALYRARLRTLEKSEESVRLATLGLKTGTRTNTEVLDAELDLFRSRAGLVRSQVDAVEALYNLEIALGYKL